MQEVGLTLDLLLERAEALHAANALVEATVAGPRTTTYGEWADRSRRLSGVLDRLGVEVGGRVASCCFSTQRHLELYFGVPCAGRVLHTVNPRMFGEQIAYVLDHAVDQVLFVDRSLLGVVTPLLADRDHLRHVVVIDDGAGPTDRPEAGVSWWDYDALLAESEPQAARIDDERQAAAICFTGGTTGNPKGVVYTHRSLVLHAMATMMAGTMGIQESDVVLPVVPLFHANAVGFAHAAVATGARLVLPGPDLSGGALAELMERERVTVACGVPTIWSAVLPEVAGRDLSALRLIISGASAVPPALSEAFREQVGLPLTQIWGMTETSPLGSIVSVRPRLGEVTPDRERRLRATVGLPVLGVQMRLVDQTGAVAPWDGSTVGELQVRGPWVAAGYLDDDRSEGAMTDDGWLRTGDAATIDADGYVAITDRLKDVIKSGGEWVSSIDLENAIGLHPAVAEVAVIGVVDEQWGERPLCCVVLRPGGSLTVEELRTHLDGKVASWWVPDRIEVLEEIPRTAVGKFSKIDLRARFDPQPDGEP